MYFGLLQIKVYFINAWFCSIPQRKLFSVHVHDKIGTVSHAAILAVIWQVYSTINEYRLSIVCFICHMTLSSAHTFGGI
jgi:hypothetical protein